MRRVALVGVAVGCLILAPGVGFAQASNTHDYSYAKVRVVDPQGHRVVAKCVDGLASSGAVAGTITVPGPDLGRAFLKPAHGRTIFIKVKSFAGSFVEAASANGIVVVAAYKPRSKDVRTYRRLPSGRLKRIKLPGPDPTGDGIAGIDNAGDMVAFGFSANGQHRSFIERHGDWKTFRLQGHPVGSTYVSSINDHGTIVGGYTDVNGVEHGFIDRKGRVHVVNLPRAGTKSGRGSQIQAIADNGIWVGSAILNDSNADTISYFHRPGHSLERIRFPKAHVDTFVDCVNCAGEVGGEYTTDQRSMVGFIAKPA